MIAELCIDVINSFKQLRTCLATAAEQICVYDKDLPAWFQAPPKLGLDPKLSYRQQACVLLGQFEYLDGQLPREVLIGAGIIAASENTLASIEALNQAKHCFKHAMLKLKAAKITSNHEMLIQDFESMLLQRDTATANTLARIGLARVHLKQCYRKIPYFMQRPRKISWTWANTRSIKKISVTEAHELLQKHLRDPGIERQIKLLQGLDHSQKLAVIQDLAPHLRANIVLPIPNGEKRIMVKGPLPIFYLVETAAPLPDFTPPGDKRGKDPLRVVRKDVKINPEPFLPAIRAHRYNDAP